MPDADGPAFGVTERRDGPALVVSVTGEVDLATAPEVKAAATDPGAQRLVLDLQQVGFMDTSGIRLVVELMRVESQGGAELHVVAGHQAVLRLFDMAGLTGRLRIARSVDEALR